MDNTNEEYCEFHHYSDDNEYLDSLVDITNERQISVQDPPGCCFCNNILINKQFHCYWNCYNFVSDHLAFCHDILILNLACETCWVDKFKVWNRDGENNKVCPDCLSKTCWTCGGLFESSVVDNIKPHILNEIFGFYYCDVCFMLISPLKITEEYQDVKIVCY